jgi:hypothetical protein
MPFVRDRLSEPEIHIHVERPAHVLPPPPPRLARSSAALTVIPVKEPWLSRRRAAIAVAATALASFFGAALLRGSMGAHPAAGSAQVQAPREVTPPPAAPPPPPPPHAPAVAPQPCAQLPPPPPPPVPTTIRMRVTSRPPDATVLIDGLRVGRTPLDLVLGRAERDATVKLRRSGHRSRSITVSLDRDLDLDLALQPRP